MCAAFLRIAAEIGKKVYILFLDSYFSLVYAYSICDYVLSYHSVEQPFCVHFRKEVRPMHHMKKWISLVTAFALASALCSGAFAAKEDTGFVDVAADAWYADAIIYCNNSGLMNGMDNDQFLPDATMNRAMFATVLYRIAGQPAVSQSGTFSDVPANEWYSAGVEWAAQHDIITGYEGNRFGLNDPVTREQLATILWRYENQPTPSASANFADSAKISSWATNAVSWAQEQQIIGGRPGNVFDPQGKGTRAEVSTILFNYMTLGGDGGEEVPEEPDEPEEPNHPEEPETPEEPDDDWKPTQPGTVDANTYDKNAFEKNENGYLIYTGKDASDHIGIDVSTYQKDIDWEQVADSGVEFAIIRVGFRGYGSTGNIKEDSYYKQNIEGALDAGLDVGVYFFSQAITEEEAVEEAKWTLNAIKGYDISYPVVFDWEYVNIDGARTEDVGGRTITACSKAFSDTVKAAGYTPMVYSNPSMVYNEIDLAQLKDYDFWLANYTTNQAPTSFKYHYDMWQYSDKGQVPGITGNVDLNIGMKNFG